MIVSYGLRTAHAPGVVTMRRFVIRDDLATFTPIRM